MATLKINEEEILKIQELQSKNSNILLELGDLEVGSRRITKRREELHAAWDELIKEDQAFGQQLSEKYGKGTFNFQTNEYTTED